MATPEVIALLADACLRGDPDLAALCAKHDVTEDDARALAAAGPRLAVYRRLVRGNLLDVTHKMLAGTRARMEELFDATFDAFLDEEGPRTHYLRDVPHDFFAWAAPRWRDNPRVPSWVVDHAANELADFAVSAAPDDPEDAELGPPAPETTLVFTRACRLLRLRYAVHAWTDGASPEQRVVALLVHRDAEHQVRRLELTPFAADLVDALLNGATLGASVTAAAAVHGAAALEDVAALLTDLAARGIILGAAR